MTRFLVVAALLLSAAQAPAQSMYKYRGENGEWIYTDRKPDDGSPSEILALPQGAQVPEVRVTHRVVDRQIRFTAHNEYHAPVELVIELQRLINAEAPGDDGLLAAVVPARGRLEVLRLNAIDDSAPPDVELRIAWLHGDPDAVHSPTQPYRAPFAAAREFRITQAYPVNVTHTSADSLHAVDIAMPIGTDVYAARAGTVFDVSSTNFRGGLDTSRLGARANVVRILHEDGTYAVYAHLNWNSIRVRPGDTVRRGEYIADSGNTGFSTGPHLHFAVLRNSGLNLESVPVEFAGLNDARVQPQTGAELAAY
ncbi:MAG: M23 family metallopeptidase [Gammaproteobacteria bacterium]|nr:M23 family metallopeptidase [Gammaproteobacteria bacterium]